MFAFYIVKKTNIDNLQYLYYNLNMQNFESDIVEVIKKLQQIIIQNTVTLDDTIRSEVYSKFQGIKYKMIDAKKFSEENGINGATAYFSPADNCVYVLDYGNTKIKAVSLLHEILHAISSTTYDNSIFTKNLSGFKCNKTFNYDNAVVVASRNRGINEAATEYFAEKFLNINSTNCYPFEVHIFSLLCEECGYEKLKNAYFGHNSEELKNIIKDGFYLKDDYLYDELMNNLNVFNVIYGKSSKDYFTSLPLVKNCYGTLLKMKLNKLMAENNFKMSLEEMVTKFSVQKYLSQNTNVLYKDFFKSFFLDLELNKFATLCNSDHKKFSTDFLTKTSLMYASIIANKNVELFKRYEKHFKQNELEILRQLCLENLYCKKHESGQYFKIPNDKLISTFLGLMHEPNQTIDLSGYNKNQKYEYISLALYNKYQDPNKEYIHFSADDLIEFINTGYYECDAFFDEKAMEYIWPKIDKVSRKLFEVQEFNETYQNVKAKIEEKEFTEDLV